MIKSLAPAYARLRPSPKRFLILILCLSSLAGTDARANNNAPLLKEKDVERGERILARLRALEQSQMEAVNPVGRKRELKIPHDLFAQVAELRTGDLKTELTTAIFLYDEAFVERNATSSAPPDCESELRDVYARLCRENKGSAPADYLLAKARLHSLWAEAAINDYRGVKTASTIALLEERRRERRDDVRFAAEALEALKSLEGEVNAYSSLADYEERRRLARVPFERLSADIAKALPKVDRVLGSLPRGPLFYSLYHARNAYADGLFWWRKTERQSKMVVNVNSFEEPSGVKERNPVGDAVIDYTVVINWRKAIRYTREAATLIEALKTD